MRKPLRTNALIESWFDLLAPELQAVARALHGPVLAASDRLEATLRWGNIVYQYSGTNAAALIARKNCITLQLFQGAALSERYEQLQGIGKGVRYIKFRNTAAVDAEFISGLISAALDVLHPKRNEPMPPPFGAFDAGI